MAKCEAVYKELRFIIEEELTQVYIAMDAVGDCPIGIQGWHHKTFPASKNIEEILVSMFSKEDDCMLWPQKAPGES